MSLFIWPLNFINCFLLNHLSLCCSVPNCGCITHLSNLQDSDRSRSLDHSHQPWHSHISLCSPARMSLPNNSKTPDKNTQMHFNTKNVDHNYIPWNILQKWCLLIQFNPNSEALCKTLEKKKLLSCERTNSCHDHSQDTVRRSIRPSSPGSRCRFRWRGRRPPRWHTDMFDCSLVPKYHWSKGWSSPHPANLDGDTVQRPSDHNQFI